MLPTESTILFDKFKELHSQFVSAVSGLAEIGYHISYKENADEMIKKLDDFSFPQAYTFYQNHQDCSLLPQSIKHTE